jgi:hypothetical protein
MAADEREARGNQQRAPQPLRQARGHQKRQGRRQRAGRGGEPEEARAGDEDAAQSVSVAERAANEHERAEHQQVAGHHPLHASGGRTEVPLHCRQGEIDHGAFDERKARPEDSRRQHPGLVAPWTGGALLADPCAEVVAGLAGTEG